MFHSATLKLTGWYLLILMTISLIFSVAIYSITVGEVGDRLEQLQSRFERSGVVPVPTDDDLHNPRYTAFRIDQDSRAKGNLLISLAYVNILILITGGAASYAMARRTLRGIESAHEAQSRFTSDASHELRTPLAVMKMELELALKDKNLSKAELREILESNLEEVDKLSRLSQMLLQLSKAEYDKIEMTRLDLAHIVKNVVKRQNQLPERIRITTAHMTPAAYGNTSSIEELVMVLVDNALKYSPSDSLVTIKLSKRSGKTCLEITNTGNGIAPENLPHIFDRFYRADASRTGGEKSGYGLGLALAKKIVEIHHGELSATSAVNHATTFTVLLPTFRQTQAKSQD
jgi:signal transduction histidine kinase